MNRIVIPLDQLNEPRDICGIMKGVKYYNYGFFDSNGKAFNYGKATDSEWKSGSWGNRIYRKAGGIPGWQHQIRGKGTDDMIDLLKRFLPDIKKDEVTIVVYDHTQDLIAAKSDNFEIEEYVFDHEHTLITEHSKLYGETPALNIQKTRPHKPTMFNNLFYFAA